MVERRVASLEEAIQEVQFARQHVPMYRRLLDSDGRLRTAQDFSRLPLSTKALFRQNGPTGVLADLLSDGGPVVRRSISSGTAGDRLATMADRSLLAERHFQTLTVHPPILAFHESLARPRSVRIAAPNCSAVECANPSSELSSRVVGSALVLRIAHDLMATADDVLDAGVAEIAAWRPDMVDADPIHLQLLARHYRLRSAAPPPLGTILLGYSMATASAWRDVMGLFGPVPAADVYGMTEFGWIGMRCPLGSMHLNASSYYLELLGERRALRPGEIGELVVTSIGDRVSPHIRYATGDLFTPRDAPCACGHPFPSFRFEGRRRDVLRIGRRVVTPRAVDALLGAAPWLAFYRLEQHNPSDFRIRYVADGGVTRQRARWLTGELRTLLGRTAEIRVERVGYISTEWSGKFVTCSSRLSRAMEDEVRHVATTLC